MRKVAMASFSMWNVLINAPKNLERTISLCDLFLPPVLFHHLPTSLLSFLLFLFFKNSFSLYCGSKCFSVEKYDDVGNNKNMMRMNVTKI